jgi:hypothetical protein
MSLLKYSLRFFTSMADSWITSNLQATHLGIKRDNKSKTGTKEVVADRIQIARRTVYALMGAGLHGLSGLNPRASIHHI